MGYALILLLLVAGAELRGDFIADWKKLNAARSETYSCFRASGPIAIDGKADEASWMEAPWTADFQDIEGTAKPKPRFRTRAKMLWDDNYFYIAAELEEPNVWGTLTNHDSVIFHDPDFEVFIDPDGDRHNYYEFEMNALNTTWDLLLRKAYIDGGPAVNEWEIPGIKTGVHVRGTLNNPRDKDDGWSVEIAFPWKALAEFSKQAAPPKGGDRWRVDFSRVEWQVEVKNGKTEKIPNTKEDNWVWSPMGIVDMHRPEKWGYVVFDSAEASRARRASGNPKPRPDIQQDAKRDRVLECYYAEKDFQKAQQRWSFDLTELFGPEHKGADKLKLRQTADGFEAEAGGWRIREDGLLTPVNP